MTNRTVDLSTVTVSLSDGRTLAYSISGAEDGRPAVAHHGTPGSRLFAGMLSDAAAANGVRLVVPDRPGYGKSSPPPREWTWRDWRDDLHELFDAESIDRAPVAGFSGGAPFALAAADSNRVTRAGVVSAVVPPAENGLATLSKVPFALRLLFRLSKSLARVRGPEAVVQQYTTRSVSETMAAAVADDFHEALRRGSRAVSRENRLFATDSLDAVQSGVPLRAWHGTRDENTPIAPVESFVDDSSGTLTTVESDHLSTLLDCRRDVFEWLSAASNPTCE